MPEDRACIAFRLNGLPHVASRGETVLDLLGRLGFSQKRVAVERNRDIVPRSQHASTYIEPDDAIEIVQFVGGG